MLCCLLENTTEIYFTVQGHAAYNLPHVSLGDLTKECASHAVYNVLPACCFFVISHSQPVLEGEYTLLLLTLHGSDCHMRSLPKGVDVLLGGDALATTIDLCCRQPYFSSKRSADCAQLSPPLGLQVRLVSACKP